MPNARFLVPQYEGVWHTLSRPYETKFASISAQWSYKKGVGSYEKSSA
jgi:hypothetical protein